MTETQDIQSKPITLDTIIEKFIPIVGALFMAVGLGYLLYTGVWVNLATPVRITLGFFVSLCIIAGAYSMPSRVKYLADVIMGVGVLVFYGSLIYGSRTTEPSQLVIPEMATLVSGLLFTAAVAYLAKLRNSKAILVLGMVGAYITPFVIGTVDSWAQTISFNSYLVYFAVTNAVIFYLGKSVGVRDVLPMNLMGLFFGTTSLYLLSYNGQLAADTMSAVGSANVSMFLFFIIAILSAISINTSAKDFRESGEMGYVTVGYMLPTLWFLYSSSLLTGASDILKSALCISLGIAYIGAWYLIKDAFRKSEVVTVYGAGILTIFSGLFFAFPEMSVGVAIFISYFSFVFGGLYLQNEKRDERLGAYFLFAFVGALLTLSQAFGDMSVDNRTLWAVVGLVPSILFVALTRSHAGNDVRKFGMIYSVSAAVLATLLIVSELMLNLDVGFMIFVLPGFIAICMSTKGDSTDSNRSTLLRMGAIWMGIGFIGSFIALLDALYPAPLNTSLFGSDSIVFSWIVIKSVFAILGLFIALGASRDLQRKNGEARPSFLLVLMGYSSLVLLMNYVMNALINDFSIGAAQGGPRAVATTFVWLVVAIWMMVVGIRKKGSYLAEKFFGLALLSITVMKVLFYDLATMTTDKKIIVMMVVGGGLLLFSYFVQQNGWLKSSEEQK